MEPAPTKTKQENTETLELRLYPGGIWIVSFIHIENSSTFAQFHLILRKLETIDDNFFIVHEMNTENEHFFLKSFWSINFL